MILVDVDHVFSSHPSLVRTPMWFVHLCIMMLNDQLSLAHMPCDREERRDAPQSSRMSIPAFRKPPCMTDTDSRWKLISHFA